MDIVEISLAKSIHLILGVVDEDDQFSCDKLVLDDDSDAKIVV
jgi:hypothetical protein